MGKTIIQQARGHGSLTYRVRRKAFSYRIRYPKREASGEGEVLKLIHSGGHSSPLAKIKQVSPACVFFNFSFFKTRPLCNRQKFVSVSFINFFIFYHDP